MLDIMPALSANTYTEPLYMYISSICEHNAA